MPLAIDVAEFHTYGVDWRPGSLAFTVDGHVVHGSTRPLTTPCSSCSASSTSRAGGRRRRAGLPELVVSHVRGRPLG